MWNLPGSNAGGFLFFQQKRQWASQEQNIAERWQDLLDESSTGVLLSADVDRIQDYVFESARLPEIRGASMLVEALNDEAADYLGKWLIYKGGGSLLAILPDWPTAEQAKNRSVI